MLIESSVPTRIDLAGSTLDIWPLYLFHDHSQTINLTINLFATCKLETRNDNLFRIKSVDTGLGVEGTLADLQSCGKLNLITQLISFFRPTTGFNLTTECSAPVGSGLGGSSALSIAVCGALNELCDQRYTPRQLLSITQNVETKVIRVLTGVQDYYSAMYGNLNTIHMNCEGVERELLTTDLEALFEQTVLCYTGKPHFSGTNNWDITRRHIEGDPALHNLLEQIRNIAINMRSALLESDRDRIAELLNEEWQLRRLLSSGVSIPKIDNLVEVARRAGSRAAKVCGAGGGGCVVFIVEPGKKSAVEAAIADAGGEVLNFQFVTKGLEVRRRENNYDPAAAQVSELVAS